MRTAYILGPADQISVYSKSIIKLALPDRGETEQSLCNDKED